MDKAGINARVLEGVEWNQELDRVSIRGDERVLWIMVDKDTGEIQKISKRLYEIHNTIQGHLCIKGDLKSREFELKLSTDCKESWPENVFSVVEKSLEFFGPLSLS